MRVRPIDPSRSRVVLVGVPHYQDPELPDVPVIARNIADMADVFTDGEIGGLPPAHCVSVSRHADQAEVGDVLTRAADDAQDLLLFYYSGHGLLSQPGRELYLGLARTRRDRLEFSALRYEAVRSACNRSRAACRVVILDSCFSGRAIGQTLAGEDDAVLAQLDIAGTYTLTSAPANSPAVTLPGERHTAFTERLLALLRTGSPDSGSMITMAEIYQHLYRRMVAEGLPLPQRLETENADLIGLVRNRWPAQERTDWQHSRPGRGANPTADQPPGRSADEADTDWASVPPSDPPSARSGDETGAGWAASASAAQGDSRAASVPTSARWSLWPASGLSGLSRRQILAASTGLGVAATTTAATWLLTHSEHSARPTGSDGSDAPSTPAAAAPLGRPLTLGSDQANAVAFCPVGHLLVVGTGDGAIQFWDVTDPAEPVTVYGPLSTGLRTIRTLAFSPDGGTLCAGGGNGETGWIQFWNVADPKQISGLGPPVTVIAQALTINNYVSSVAFSRDGKTLAVATELGTLVFWDVADPAQPTALGPSVTTGATQVYSVAFSPNGDTLAVSSATEGGGGLTQLWNISADGRQSAQGQSLDTGTDDALALSFSSGGNVLIVGGDLNSTDSGLVTLWDVAEPAQPTMLGQLAISVPGVRAMAVTPDGHTMATAGNAVELWSITRPDHPSALGWPPGPNADTGSVFSLSFSPDGRILAAGGYNPGSPDGTGTGTVWLWQLPSSSA